MDNTKLILLGYKHNDKFSVSKVTISHFKLAYKYIIIAAIL